MKNIILYLNLLFISLSFGQLSPENINGLSNNTGERYISGADGVIRMYVNVWGNVPSPGRILVVEGIDLATLLSLIGGPRKGTNLKRIRVYHEYPNKDGKNVEVIDLTSFVKNGDRSEFIEIQPNDTFIIEQTAWSYFLKEIGTVNTLMSLLNIYLNLNNVLK
tara:strand:+ start:5335 stop:5823 length:489 start_codon:yes stop_codon:yes gene_type:complete